MSTRGSGLPGYVTAAPTFGVAGDGNIRLFFIDSTVRLLWGRGGSDTIIP